MKTPIDAVGNSGGTVALLNSGSDFEMVDLWSITLNGGTVVRWHGAEEWAGPISFNGNTWLQGPGISRGKITSKLGVEVATLDATFVAGPSDQINSVALIPFVTGRGFDGATVQLMKALIPKWGQPVTGCIIDFAGRVTEIKNISRQGFTMTISSWTVLLNVSMGPDVFQAGCLNSHYDADCGLTEGFIVGQVTGGSSVTGFQTNLNQVSGYFSKGRIIFTSGANNGLSRAVTTYSSVNGAVAVAYPLPYAPAVGDTFKASRGCLLTMADCTAQNNLIHFRGQPFTPPAITGTLGG